MCRYRIDALTITGKSGQQHRLRTVGDVVEGVFRSINNLLEALHQSFFFYILPSTDRYISIGVYMPPFALIAVAGLIQISFSTTASVHLPPSLLPHLSAPLPPSLLPSLSAHFPPSLLPSLHLCSFPCLSAPLPPCLLSPLSTSLSPPLPSINDRIKHSWCQYCCPVWFSAFLDAFLKPWHYGVISLTQ